MHGLLVQILITVSVIGTDIDNTFSWRRLTSARQTLASFFRSVLALLRALLLFRTGTLIMGVLMLELATVRISLSLGIRCGGSKVEKHWDRGDL